MTTTAEPWLNRYFSVVLWGARLGGERWLPPLWPATLDAVATIPAVEWELHHAPVALSPVAPWAVLTAKASEESGGDFALADQRLDIPLDLSRLAEYPPYNEGQDSGVVDVEAGQSRSGQSSDEELSVEAAGTPSAKRGRTIGGRDPRRVSHTRTIERGRSALNRSVVSPMRATASYRRPGG
jgi:hypothetical protein